MAGTEKLSRVLWCKFLDISFVFVFCKNLTINIFIFDFGRLQAKLHFLQKRQITVSLRVYSSPHSLQIYLYSSFIVISQVLSQFFLHCRAPNSPAEARVEYDSISRQKLSFAQIDNAANRNLLSKCVLTAICYRVS